ncbi:MAG: LacI family DNA-binding transcriptional regulator, partial [Clostridia bacterium]|nr:LacI family DNA-binding transcriptional regulator [Clostridia bacterium]
MSNVTIRELAAACGVSIGTVSKALNCSERISGETARRIREKAEELGYVGNHAARALSSRGRRVALVLPAASPHLECYRRAFREMEPTLLSYGLFSAEVAPEEADAYDAVVAHAAMASRLSLGEGKPAVLFGGRAPSFHSLAEILPDYRVGGRLAAQFLAFATGGGAAAILTTRRGVAGEDEAVRGFRELSAKLGIPVTAVLECGDNPRSISAEVRRLLAAAPRLRGLFVTGPITSAVVATLGESRRRLSVVASDFTRPA